MTGLVKSVNFELFIGVRLTEQSSFVLNSRSVQSIDIVLNEKISKTVVVFESIPRFFLTMNSERKGKSMKYQIATAVFFIRFIVTSHIGGKGSDNTTSTLLRSI